VKDIYMSTVTPIVRSLLAVMALVALLAAAPAIPQAQGDMHDAYDTMLDTHVRGGMVYYRMLKSSRGVLDRYVASLDIPKARVEGWGKAEQQAFWINAYNAHVLRTVIDAYPINGRSAQYPPNSIRQIPGAFETIKHRVAGQVLTLDEIEKNVISTFGDARMFLALGRGAVGSARLQAAAFRGSTLEAQLARAVRECAIRSGCAKLDRDMKVLTMTPILSWREDAFVATFASKGEPMWANRTPIERAAAAMVYPYLFETEKEFLAANTFRMQYGTFDWRLNDLTGGAPE
jgi:hypothetical protein